VRPARPGMMHAWPGGPHTGIVWPPRWLRWRFQILAVAAVVFGGAGLLLGPAWATAGIALGPLVTLFAIVIVLLCSKPDPAGLMRAGRTREALRQLDYELPFRRRLATRWPTFRDVLALQLVTKSQALQQLGKEPQALDAADEAVAIYTEFAAKRPRGYNSALASSLLQQAGLLAGLSRHGEALGAIQTAVRLYRDLAAADRSTYLPRLALALTRQSDELGYLDRIAEARAAAAEAALIRTDMLPPARTSS